MPQPAPFATYVDDGDILYVRLSDAAIARTRELDPWRNVDYAEDDSVVAVEFVNASAGLDLEGVPRHDDVLALIKGLGLDPRLLELGMVIQANRDFAERAEREGFVASYDQEGDVLTLSLGSRPPNPAELPHELFMVRFDSASRKLWQLAFLGARAYLSSAQEGQFTATMAELINELVVHGPMEIRGKDAASLALLMRELVTA